MTFITGGGEKKPEKLAVPLFSDDAIYRNGVSTPAATIDSKASIHDVEAENNANINYIHRRSLPTLFLLLTALFVMGLGILGGVYLYRQYAHQRVPNLRFHGFCGVPYDSSSMDNKAMVFMNSKWRDDSDFILDPSVDVYNQVTEELSHMEDQFNNDFFKEEFELGLSDDESYSKITVPDYRDGRHGRFLHDFKNNQSSIIDKNSNRCFVMPLDRDTVLPPQSFYDLITKMWNGYYDIDTDTVRQDYRVVTPAISDLSDISPRIANECTGMNIYMLQKYVSGVYKRSIISVPEAGKFAEFTGRKIIEFDLVNINDLDEFEKKNA